MIRSDNDTSRPVEARPTTTNLSYRDAGVDIDAGDALVARIKPHVARTRRPGVLGGEMIIDQEYALGIFHDENDNGEFDTNFLGLPSEPWAFSGKLKSRFRMPRFEEVSFRFDEDAPEQMLRLRTWF